MRQFQKYGSVVSFTCSFSIILLTLFQLWTFFWPWTPWLMHFGSARCDAGTMCGTLRLLFFYCTSNSFLPVNSVMHALWFGYMWCMHYTRFAPLALFLLYSKLSFNHELGDTCITLEGLMRRLQIYIYFGVLCLIPIFMGQSTVNLYQIAPICTNLRQFVLICIIFWKFVQLVQFDQFDSMMLEDSMRQFQKNVYVGVL